MGMLDCIIIGYNESNFSEFARTQKQFEHLSGAYSEIKTNSILLGGQRITYMDLLNLVLTKASGEDRQLNPFHQPSLGVAYLASYLLKHGFLIEMINFFNASQQKLAQLLAEGPHAVAITTTYYVYDEPIRQIVQFVREHAPQTTIIVGGPRVYSICTGNPPAVQEFLLQAIGADVYILESQGEYTLARVLACLRDGSFAQLASVPNLIYTSDQQNFTTTERSIENNDLDENAIEWQCFDRSFYTPITYMRTARSCSFACAFCNYPIFAGAHTLASLDALEAEMRFLYEQGVHYLIFVDDTFNVPLPRFKELCRRMIRNNFQFQWISFFRCSNADDEAFDLMQKSGCLGVILGIESGDAQMLKRMNKFASIERYKYGIRKLTERGILSLASLIVGFPGETRESIMNTIAFLQDTPTTLYNVQIYYHDTLAPIHQRSAEFGIERSGYSWRHHTMTWQEAVDWKKYMLQTISSSVLIPQYGFSLWSFPYLLSQGLSLKQIIDFARDTTTLLLKSHPDQDIDLSDEIACMVQRFQPSRSAD